MLNLHLNPRNTLLKFDKQLPVYNWYYPFPYEEVPTLDDLLLEADTAISLNTTTIDFYPLNYMSASMRMHRSFKEKGLQHLSPSTRTSYRIFLDEYMQAQGYHAISGYSYSRQCWIPRNSRSRRPH